MLPLIAFAASHPLLMIGAACFSMIVRDATEEMKNIYQLKGHENAAGWCDAGNDGATIAFQVLGAGQIILHGLTMISLITIAAIMVTSYCGTRFWTHVGKRIH